MPSPERNETEGYLFERGTLSFPIMGNDPHNAYGSMPSGDYFTVKDTNISFYDKETHLKYKTYIDNVSEPHVDIFRTWWGYYEIFSVDFVDGIIKDTEFYSRTEFSRSTLSDVSIEGCVFDNVSFVECEFDNTTFVNCRFINCRFHKSSLTNTVFLECDFVESRFNECEISGRIINSYISINFTYCQMYTNLFENCRHDKCDNWGCYYPFYEEYGISESWVHHINDIEFNSMLNHE
jgi:hypothetical protein